MRAHMRIWRPDFSDGYHPQLGFTLVGRQVSMLTLDWLPSMPWALLPSTIGIPGFFGFGFFSPFMFWGLMISPLVCMPSTLCTEPSPQPSLGIFGDRYSQS